jgi:ribokinase
LIPRIEVISIGGVNIDICAIIPEFPGIDEEMEVVELQELPGGSAANYIVGVARLGMKAGFIGKIGNDSYGQKLKTDFLQEKVDITQLKMANMHSGTCLVPIDKNGNRQIFSFRGANATLGPEDLSEAYIQQAAILHITSPPITVAQLAAELARKHKVLLSYDPGGKVIRKGLKFIEPVLKNTDIFFPSKPELDFLFPEVKEPKRAALQLIESYGMRIVATKLGAQGCLIVTKDDIIQVKAFTVNVVDTTGAGDCFAAAFTFGIYKNWDPLRCARFANAAAAIKLTRLGARSALPTLKEIEEFLKKN